AKVLVEVRRHVHVRYDTGELAQPEPLICEIVDKRLGPGVPKHPSNLLIEHAWIGQLALRCQIEQFIVGEAAPEKERQPGSQLEIAQPIRHTSRDVRRLALHSEHETRRGENASKAVLDARVEAALLAACSIKAHQGRGVLVGERTPKRAPSD